MYLRSQHRRKYRQLVCVLLTRLFDKTQHSLCDTLALLVFPSVCAVFLFFKTDSGARFMYRARIGIAWTPGAAPAVHLLH